MERKLFAVSLAAVLLLSGCGSRSLAGGAVKDDMAAASVPSGAQGGAEADTPIGNTSAVQTLLTALSEGKCKGVKGATAYKVAQFAAEMGLV